MVSSFLSTIALKQCPNNRLKIMLNFNLKKQGILGMNARNLDYIFHYNPRNLYSLVDDKLKTKKLALKAGIHCPEVYGVIEHQAKTQQFSSLIKGHNDFVIKPAHGSGGNGILVIRDKNEYGYVKADGQTLSEEDIHYHINNILCGLYSLGGQSDKAIIEYRIQPITTFQPIAYQGVPDIRLVVYKGIPVMAMLRVPTKESDGKANLHAGGIGIGIDMKKGITTTAIQHNSLITIHPDTQADLAGVKIPNWRKILKLAARLEELIGLGYLGVDIVIDEDYGPMMLEVNARPGLSIQIANQAGLLPKLDAVDKKVGL